MDRKELLKERDNTPTKETRNSASINIQPAYTEY